MPKTVPLGQSFKYLRDQAAKAVPVGGAATGALANALLSAINGQVLTSAINGQVLTSAQGA